MRRCLQAGHFQSRQLPIMQPPDHIKTLAREFSWYFTGLTACMGAGNISYILPCHECGVTRCCISSRLYPMREYSYAFLKCAAGSTCLFSKHAIFNFAVDPTYLPDPSLDCLGMVRGNTQYLVQAICEKINCGVIRSQMISDNHLFSGHHEMPK